MKQKILSMIMALVMIATCLVSPAMATPTDAEISESALANVAAEPAYSSETGEITYHSAEPKDTTGVEILVAVEGGNTTFLETSDLTLATASADAQELELYAAASQVESVLGMAIEDADYYSLLFNGFSFAGEMWMVDAINEMEGLSATVAPMFELIAPEEEETEIDLTPAMSISTEMVGAVNAWDLGYTGKGMAVAVIDTGIKQTHEAFSVAPEGAKMDESYINKVFADYGDKMHGKNTAGSYYSAKLPYNWDYVDGDCIPNHTQSNHGSHVAGIVAGNNGKEFKGIAPDAQIISLQVFTKSGGAALTDLLKAMEDAVYLGVDAINMSLGVMAGYENYTWGMDFQTVYDALDRAGIAVCVAAGND